ncbi:DNA-directed RNA polymerase subunit beta [Cohnella fermenti]|uniref:DNA-directed RNA polymerase subunit beta n=1 Tax=Cohnella fermenti TaxID=2565925 RepID=UPI001E5EF190|nr:DNA-directed RNA polymerase subunit beta [Cohnella fermenti]
MTASNRPAAKKRRSVWSLFGQIVGTTVKILIIPVLCVVALVVGLAIGYVVLGDGELADVFDMNTWKHMYDLVFTDGN